MLLDIFRVWVRKMVVGCVNVTKDGWESHVVKILMNVKGTCVMKRELTDASTLIMVTRVLANMDSKV